MEIIILHKTMRVAYEGAIGAPPVKTHIFRKRIRKVKIGEVQ
jgi:hypothetical protein